MILTEELKPISPQEARDKHFFGPVYHGATSDKLEKINVQGFKIPVGHERSGDVSHGYEMGGYGYGSIPAPIHHLGFGVYFTTVKTIAKQFSEGNPKIGPYFLDIPRVETINFGSPNTMMKWWIENGYDYKRTPETTFGSGKTDLYLIREERMRATLHLTETLKSKYDAVWFKGKGMRGRLLDGDQVVVFDPNRIYKVDKSLVKPGEIGSKVIATVDIDPYGRGNVAVHAGTKGIIVDKEKPTELQTWTEGSKWIYTIRWEKGGIVYNIIDKWIEPYTSKRGLKEIDNEIKTYPVISKKEEMECVNYILNGIMPKMIDAPTLRKNLRKVEHRKRFQSSAGIHDLIKYRTYSKNIKPIIFAIVRIKDGVGVSSYDEGSGRGIHSYRVVIHPEVQPLKENSIIRRNFWKDYENSVKKLQESSKSQFPPMTKMEEQEALQTIIRKWRAHEVTVGNFHKIAVRNPSKSSRMDEREYTFTMDGTKKRYLIIRKIANGFFYRIFSEPERLIYDKEPDIFVYSPVYDDFHTRLEEGDAEHSQALRQTGYWGKQGAGAIILAKDTGRILLPLRSDSIEQPNTWGVWGGAIDEDETPSSAVRRELSEEVGYQLQIDELIPLYVYEDPRVGFRYSNFLAIIPNEFTPRLNNETQKSEWVKYGMWPKPMHFGLKLLLSHSSNEIKNEVKKYSKDLQNVKTPAMQKEKFKAAVDLINNTWAMMYRGGAIQDPRDRFDTQDVNMWLLNDQSTGNMLERYGQQFYPFDNEPGYKFLEDVETVLGQLEERYYKRISKKLDPNDPLSALKRVVQGKSWNKAKYDLVKFSLSGPIVVERIHISDEEAELTFNRLYRVAMGETFYDVTKMESLPTLSDLTYSQGHDVVNTFVKYYIPRDRTEFPPNVRVYRGAPSPHIKIRPGDFTSFDKDYVRYYIRGKYGAVISDVLPSKHLRVYKLEPGQSELIYWPEGHQIQRYTGHIPTFKEFYLQYK